MYNNIHKVRIFQWLLLVTIFNVSNIICNKTNNRRFFKRNITFFFFFFLFFLGYRLGLSVRDKQVFLFNYYSNVMQENSK
jgi:hypothetical protein